MNMDKMNPVVKSKAWKASVWKKVDRVVTSLSRIEAENMYRGIKKVSL
jgi:hypothetical protein